MKAKAKSRVRGGGEARRIKSYDISHAFWWLNMCVKRDVKSIDSSFRKATPAAKRAEIIRRLTSDRAVVALWLLTTAFDAVDHMETDDTITAYLQCKRYLRERVAMEYHKWTDTASSTDVPHAFVAAAGHT